MAELPTNPKLLADLVDSLENENDELRERIRQLEEQLYRTDTVWPLDFELTPQEGRILGALMASTIVSKPAAMNALYQHRPDGGENVGDKIVDVFICKLRAKLKRFDGITIETIWGQGYRLTAATKALIKQMTQTAVSG